VIEKIYKKLRQTFISKYDHSKHNGISQLIEKHGGEIVRNDVSPDGVEFTIRLPHASAEALRVAQTES